MADETQVPSGFRLESDTTSVGENEYPVEFLQAESLEAVLRYYEENAQGDPVEIVAVADIDPDESRTKVISVFMAHLSGGQDH
jgi:hypothetical protein